MLPRLEAALQRATGRPELKIKSAAALTGGCIHEARRLETSEGDFFAKWSATAPADIFLREAEGLNALRLAGAEILVPRVLAAEEARERQPAFLILEYLAPAQPGDVRDDPRFGRGLAAIHRVTSGTFGFPTASYCGATRQDNTQADSWPDFFRQRRLEPLMMALCARGDFDSSDRDMFERLFVQLDRLLSTDQPPALIHGDLWSGNVLWSALGPGLVDPACAFADREMEFGMSELFGGLSGRAMSAYRESFPLPAGWRDRNPLYQLYHLLNHAILFGGSYVETSRAVARRFAG